MIIDFLRFMLCLVMSKSLIKYVICIFLFGRMKFGMEDLLFV